MEKGVQWSPQIMKDTTQASFLEMEELQLFPHLNFSFCNDMQSVNNLFRDKQSKGGWMPVKKDDIQPPDASLWIPSNAADTALPAGAVDIRDLTSEQITVRGRVLVFPGWGLV